MNRKWLAVLFAVLVATIVLGTSSAALAADAFPPATNLTATYNQLTGMVGITWLNQPYATNVILAIGDGTAPTPDPAGPGPTPWGGPQYILPPNTTGWSEPVTPGPHTIYISVWESYDGPPYPPAATFTLVINPPASPTNFQAHPNADLTALNLTWDSPDALATSTVLVDGDFSLPTPVDPPAPTDVTQYDKYFIDGNPGAYSIPIDLANMTFIDPSYRAIWSRVWLVNKDGHNDPAEITVDLPEAVAPSAPTNLSVQFNPGDGKWHATWDNTTEWQQADYFGIGQDVVPQGPFVGSTPTTYTQQDLSRDATSTSFTLASGHHYYFRLWSWNKWGASTAVDAEVDIPLQVPAAVTNFTVHPTLTAGGYPVSWDKPSTETTGLVIAEWDGSASAPTTPPLDGSFPCQLTQLSGDATSFNWHPSSPNRSYTVAIWAGNKAGWSSPSFVTFFAPFTTPPAAVTGLAIGFDAGLGKYKATWSNPDALATGTVVTFSATPPAPGSAPPTSTTVLSADTTSSTFAVSPGSTVWCTIWRLNDVGSSPLVTQSVTVPVPIVNVATATSLKAPSSVKKGKTLKLTGSVSPSAAPGKVRIYLYRYYSGKWHTQTTTVVNVSGGNYSYSFKPKYKGNWRFRTNYLGGSSGNNNYLGSWSTYKATKVK